MTQAVLEEVSQLAGAFAIAHACLVDATFALLHAADATLVERTLAIAVDALTPVAPIAVATQFYAISDDGAVVIRITNAGASLRVARAVSMAVGASIAKDVAFAAVIIFYAVPFALRSVGVT